GPDAHCVPRLPAALHGPPGRAVVAGADARGRQPHAARRRDVLHEDPPAQAQASRLTASQKKVHLPVEGKRGGAGCRTRSKPGPAVAGRPLRVSKGGGSRRRRGPGDMKRKGLPAAAGPVRSRRGMTKRRRYLSSRSWEKNQKIKN